MTLKEFKQLVKTSPLITIYNAPVKFDIKEKFVVFSWRGVDTGTEFSGGVNEANLANFKNITLNGVAVQLASSSNKGKVIYNKGFTPILFWHKIELPITSFNNTQQN